jgi:protoheme ferro-lyase
MMNILPARTKSSQARSQLEWGQSPLTRISQDQGVKLYEVARQVAETREVPGTAEH